MNALMKQVSTAVVTVALIAGCSPSPNVQQQSAAVASIQPLQRAEASERLGTQWGDEVSSQVTTVNLRRTSKNPLEQMQIYYADKRYAGRTVNSHALLAGKIEFSVSSDRQRLPMYRDSGNYYLQGKEGQAYQLRYHNNSDRTYEIVASVDGIDVIDGSAASKFNSGYVLRPHGNLVIEGFRKSDSAVASFIFSKPKDAYAANTPSGSIDNTGVIGTAIYELYDPDKAPQKSPHPFPADNGYAKPPQ